MADFTSTGWTAGETVTAGAVSATPPGASGSTVDSDVATAVGAVTFTGLAVETEYRATGGTSGRSVRFRTGVPVVEGAALSVVITGNPTVGEVLTATVSDEVTSPAYQWQRDGANISGATSATYTVRTADVDHEVTCVVDGSVSVESDAVIGVAAAEGATPDALFPGWYVAEEFSLADDPTNFTITNYDVSGGNYTLADAFAVGRIATVATDIEAAEVLVSYIPFPQAPLSIQNISMRPFVRRQDASNLWFADRIYGDGNSALNPHEKVAGADVAGASFGTGLDNTDTTNVWFLKIQVFYDVIRAKTWTGNIVDDEPSWLGVPLRIRPSFGWGGTNTTEFDNIAETGAAGVEANYGGTISDVVVKRLARTDPTNLLPNAAMDPELVDGSGRPLLWGWDSKWTTETDGIVEFTTAVGPDGSTTIPVIRLAKSVAGAADSPELVQEFYRTDSVDNAAYSRNRPFPTVGDVFPPSFDGSIWIKTTNIADSIVQIGAVQHVLYYSDGAGVGQNVGRTDYYGPLAPNSGSQAWTHVTFNTPINDFADIVRATLSQGMHDGGATGEVLIAGGDWGPTLTAGA